MRAVKKVLATLCFVIGAAFALGAAETVIYSSYDDSGAGLPGMFAVMLLLGGFLLLRKRQPTRSEPPHANVT
jgi:MYXO-CTERM domain-containing protein